MNYEKSNSGLYFLSGCAVGAVFGLLFAPRKGSETREGIGDWTQRARDSDQGFVSKIVRALPLRVKGAAAYGAVKEGGRAAVHQAGQKIEKTFGSPGV